jgi:putative ABC transport system ATP-binding protein
VDEAILVVAGLTKVYGTDSTRVEALRGVDFTLRRGEFVAVMGPSGSGKSSLLHLLAGLDQPSGGSIRLDGTDLARLNEDERALLRRKHIGLMFQSFQLLDTMTAEENVALPLAIAGCAANEARQRAARLLGAVGLAHRRGHRPHEMSGGEQQRVALARALVVEPLLLLADEPTGNLDSARGDEMMNLLRQMVEERRQTLLMVTHEPKHAARADRIIHLRDGRIEASSRRQPADPAKQTPVVYRAVECVEWSVVPPPSTFNAVSFVTPCAADALEHAPDYEDAA